MQTTFIMSALLLFTLMSLTTKSLLFMMVMLILTALFTTVLIVNVLNSWFAFILFLIYVTGLLVLFSYMLAMTPNTYSMKLSAPKLFLFTVVFFHLLFTIQPTSLPEKKQDFEWHIFQIYTNENMPMYWFMALILLMALVMVVNLTYKSPTPLRPFL